MHKLKVQNIGAGLAQFFGISPETGNGLLLAARFIPEIFSPLSTRLRSYPLPFGSVFLVLLLVAFSLPAELTVSNSLLFWFFVHCFFRAYPSLLALGPPREFAATDYLGHIYGALAALLLGGWHLLRRLTVGSPHLQSWLALTVLCISTLPWKGEKAALEGNMKEQLPTIKRIKHGKNCACEKLVFDKTWTSQIRFYSTMWPNPTDQVNQLLALRQFLLQNLTSLSQRMHILLQENQVLIWVDLCFESSAWKFACGSMIGNFISEMADSGLGNYVGRQVGIWVTWLFKHWICPSPQKYTNSMHFDGFFRVLFPPEWVLKLEEVVQWAQGLTQSQLIWPGDRHVFGSVAKVKALRASDQSTVCWYFNHFSNFRAFPFSEENGNGMQCSSNQDWDENWLTVGVWTHSSPRFHLCLAKPSDECGTQGTLFSRAVVQRP